MPRRCRPCGLGSGEAGGGRRGAGAARLVSPPASPPGQGGATERCGGSYGIEYFSAGNKMMRWILLKMTRDTDSVLFISHFLFLSIDPMSSCIIDPLMDEQLARTH